MTQFQQNPNGSGRIHDNAGETVIVADARTDWFFSPDGRSRIANAPSVFLETTAPVVSFKALVSAEFSDRYDAGALFVQSGEEYWGKLAYEYSPQGIPTIVSVVTRGTSDDCDGPRQPSGAVWLRIHVDRDIVNFHFSEDGSFWRFHRTFALPRNAASRLRFGLAAQAPVGKGCSATFRHISITDHGVKDFRNGD